MQKSQIIIKRPSNLHKNHLRALPVQSVKEKGLESTFGSHPEPLRGDVNESQASPNIELPEDQIPDQDLEPTQPEDEIARIRAILKPPPIPGVEDWGISPPSTEPCNPSIHVR